MRIGIIDADLLDKGTRHPNLALMKISSYCKQKGHDTSLLLDYSETPNFDKIYMSKVFSSTTVPIDIMLDKKISKGGTGFYGAYAPDLPDEVEHSKPDYDLYKNYVNGKIEKGCKKGEVDDYVNYSIGFTTRGCFRKCNFCVNRKYNKVFAHSPVGEFLDEDRKYITLLDDNFLGFSNWKDIIEKLKDTKKPFQFKQGLDIRLLNEERSKVLSNVKYKGDFIFAFDNIADEVLIRNKLELWRKHSIKSTKLYVLVAYYSQDIKDVVSMFERIKIIMTFGSLPFIMRYKSFSESKFRQMYVSVSHWCNQPSFFKKLSFREFCDVENKRTSEKTVCASKRALVDFEKEYPEIAKKYFDMKFENENRFDNKWSDL